MLGVEPIGNGIENTGVDVAFGDRDANLEGLSEVAQISSARELVLALGEALASQRLAGLVGQCVEEALHRIGIERLGQRHVRLHVVVLDVHGEQAEGGDVARVRRHEHRGQSEYVDQPAQQEGSRPTERRQREVADVQATLHGHLAQRVGLVPRRDLEYAGGTRLG